MSVLNPIQQKIAAGMSPLIAFFSEKTCSEACWEAREDICRCSCLGKNHGCMRSANGKRPERTAKIDGVRYVLKATAPNCRSNPQRNEIYERALLLNREDQPDIHWRTWDTNVPRAGARIRNASKDQVVRWSELASYRERIAEIKRGSYCLNDIYEAWPQLLWVREDLVIQSGGHDEKMKNATV